MKLDQIHVHQDACLLAIEDGKPVPAKDLAKLPPWRAVLIGKVAQRAGVPLAGGTLEELIAEATRVGGEGELKWPIRGKSSKVRSQKLHGL